MRRKSPIGDERTVQMIDFLKPQLTVEPRPENWEEGRYVRSYLIMRALVGVLGIALPVVLVFGDGLGFTERPFPRDSLSAYYYSGTRELFVGALVATGIFLITYKVADRALDNTLSTLAGVASVLIALFPTGRPTSSLPLTPLQDRLSEGSVQAVHFGSAFVFLVALGTISYFFGVREGARPVRANKRSPKFWRNYHWFFAAIIASALLWIAITQLENWPRTSLLIGETASAWAFGASWLMKGLELDILRHP
jgi:hypothetical protein